VVLIGWAASLSPALKHCSVSETGRVRLVLFVSRRRCSLRLRRWNPRHRYCSYHCDSDMIMSLCFLTNHSRAALREAGLRETEAFQTLRGRVMSLVLGIPPAPSAAADGHDQHHLETSFNPSGSQRHLPAVTHTHTHTHTGLTCSQQLDSVRSVSINSFPSCNWRSATAWSLTLGLNSLSGVCVCVCVCNPPQTPVVYFSPHGLSVFISRTAAPDTITGSCGERG